MFLDFRPPGLKLRLAAVAATAAGACAFAAVAADNASRAPATAEAEVAHFTAEQAERGRAAYEQACMSCHGRSLRGGSNEFQAPPLAGPFFLEKWAGKSVQELHDHMQQRMPPNGEKLSPERYLDITAFILSSNRYKPSSTELDAKGGAFRFPAAGP